MKRVRAALLVVVFSLAVTLPALAGAADPYMRRGIADYNAKRYSAALTEFRKAVQVEPRNDEAWAWLGITYVALGRTKEALAAFRKSIALNPKGRQAELARRWIEKLTQVSQQPVPPPVPVPQIPPPPTPTVLYLADIPAAAGQPNFGRARLFGKDYYKAMITYTRDTGQVTVFNLERKFSRFQALVGVADNYEFYGPVVFKVQGDGRILLETLPLKSGDVPHEVNISVRGILRLELISIAPYGPLAVWADPRVIKE